ncbi:MULTISPECIES: hypothetical protein [Pseudomonas]|uniref:Uncharacterized protein n=2 Tax=Pseudomonas TaxID=286 RepID=A0A4Y9TK82_PSEFL|nr:MULTISPECIES: hypothetical protein [Pseudomonas]CRM89897.1 hypothetical protein [Pseudomonas sp. 22 E 5]MCX9151980.1 hypothetical protein [Pseudomonas sp. TB1-B1]QXH68186.1 hypothetical protein KSS96_04410 [Pseudomonas asgharzadehiana]TFW43337.1 hypothetical protein E4T65_09850 [Pseudomonas fluorescens]TKJ64738.1 hypothetical protein PspCFBP13506_09430 [Pseudomonas sp. CFBP13506]
MNTDSRVSNSLYREQVRSEKRLDQIGSEVITSEDTEEFARLFEQLNEQKSALVNNLAVNSTYLSYKHETLKSAINVV